ncbi:TPA: hypothetical protein NUW79_003134 [Escherichia coli]|nr:hypothetical protein [Escherichia coli]HCJ8610298.1 hypothetical protein [Escherichia coli]
MVKRVSLFQTADGAHFSTEAEAKAHEATVAAQATVAALLKKLKLDGSFISIGETEGVMLESFLIDNREALLLALNGNTVKVKQTRRKKTAVPETPVKEEVLAEPVAAQAQPATAVAAGNSDAQLDSLVAELGA